MPNKSDKPFGRARLIADSIAAKCVASRDDNIIVGAQSICKYVGVGSVVTLYRWIELYGFPAINRPDGVWMSSMTAIDQWIFIAAEIVNDKRLYSRGTNVDIDLAIARLERQKADPERFANKRLAAASRAARGVALLDGRKEPKVPYSGTHVGRAKQQPLSAEDLAAAEAWIARRDAPAKGGRGSAHEGDASAHGPIDEAANADSVSQSDADNVSDENEGE